ncbi:MAG: DUF3209 family protein [Deltaproteobacteria bacterium]|nr:DUF3209 family protein [Deltaproteobacteria bacterium]
MACHELTALRLGLMGVLGIEDEAEKQHELSDLGEAIHTPGPISALTQAKDMTALTSFFGHSLSDLEEKVAATPKESPDLPYLRALLITTKKVEMELQTHMDGLTRLWRDLDEIHHFIHEIYPADG